jgi:triosephosphate isomerase (TIM)
MRAKLVAGNWKMHGSLPENATLLSAVRSGTAGLRAARAAVCVPFPYLFQAQQALAGSRVAWGAQSVSQHPKGAYTGEVSAGMLRDLGCTYVLVGHSERRTLFAEDDAVVAAKFAAALGAGLTPILCVGETLQQREAGTTESVVRAQLAAAIARSGAAALGRAALAYEPVWAIGTGRTATPEQAQAVHAFLRGCIGTQDAAVAQKIQILYGGSVKAANAGELFAMPDIDGGLIGGASLIAEEFVAICQSADRAAS